MGIPSQPDRLVITRNDDGSYSRRWENPLEKFVQIIVSEVLDRVAQQSASWSDEHDRPRVEGDFGFSAQAQDQEP
jgi:hypothetical protein